MTIRRIGTLAVLGLSAATALASSHREAPFITGLPQVDATDFYLFSSYEPGRADYVTLIANYIPLQAAYGGPNYFPLDSEAVYEIHIDNDGDVMEDLTFQFRFDDVLPDSGVVTLDIAGTPVSTVLRNVAPVTAEDESGLTHRQTYQVSLVAGDRRNGAAQALTNATTGEDTFRKPFDYVGTKTFGTDEDYLAYARSFVYDLEVPDCPAPGRVFVGQRYEAFKIALGEVFDLVNLVPIEGDSASGAGDGGGFPGGVTQDPSRNALRRNNVTSIALEIHKDCLSAEGGTIIGAWTTASLPQARLLNPTPSFERPEVHGVR